METNDAIEVSVCDGWAIAENKSTISVCLFDSNCDARFTPQSNIILSAEETFSANDRVQFPSLSRSSVVSRAPARFVTKYRVATH
jgi:hypothetical protein